MNEDKATRYQRLTRRTAVASTGLTAGLLVVLVATSGSVALRRLASHLAQQMPVADQEPAATVLLYVCLLVGLSEIVGVPLAWYRGFHLEARYGLSVQRPLDWLADHLKATVITLGFALLGSELIYMLLRRWPSIWWMIAATVFAAVGVVLVNLAPVVLLPLFYRFKPLEREGLRDRLVKLAERADTRVVGAYEWRLSDRTKKANAALTGLGTTRRILVSDTLLADYSDEEIEVILAHELAHHVHRDLWTGIACETVFLVGGFYLADRVLQLLVPRVGLEGPADVAGLPLLVLVGGTLSVALRPVFNAVSRAHERRADREALRLTGNPPAFISAMRRLGAQNLAEENPSWWVRLLFYTHPPILERISTAERAGGASAARTG